MIVILKRRKTTRKKNKHGCQCRWETMNGEGITKKKHVNHGNSRQMARKGKTRIHIIKIVHGLFLLLVEFF